MVGGAPPARIAPIRDSFLRNQRENEVSEELSRPPGSINRAPVGLDYPTEVWRSDWLPSPAPGATPKEAWRHALQGKGRVSSALKDEQIRGAVGEPDLHKARVELRRLPAPWELRTIRGWRV
jgi:hypothetical protein